MATWQYQVHLIPESKLIELFGTVPDQIARDSFDQVEWWESQSLPIQELEISLGAFLKPNHSWTETIKCWGNETGDYVSVILEDNRVAEIGVRVDVRILDPELVRNICEFSERYRCLLLTENLTLIKPDRDLLLEEIVKSEASAFVLDPDAYLNGQKG